MWLLPVVAGAIVPHAPLLVPELESPEVATASATVRRAVSSIDLGEPDVVVILSPHGVETGVSLSTWGTLDEFGLRGVRTDAQTSRYLARGLAEDSGLDLVDAGLDHGVTVPLRLGAWMLPIVAVSFEEIDFEDVDSEWAAMSEGEAVARAIDRLAQKRRVAVVASVNGATGLGARAPMTEIPETRKVEEVFLDLIEADISQLSEYAIVLSRRGLSCGLAPLRIFGYLFGNRGARVLAHESPVGVGYTVAEVV